MRCTWALAAAAAVMLGGAVAQEFGTPTEENPLGAYPECAQNCIMGAFTNTTFCAPNDQACTCTSQEFSGFVTGCVMTSCSLPDALMTQNITSIDCDYPVRDRSGDLIREVWAMLIVCVLVIVGRIAFKIFDSGSTLWWDDYTMVLLLIFGGGPCMILQIVVAGPNGAGRDIWTLPFDNIDNVLMSSYILFVLYLPQVALLKLTFLFFFLRIFPNKRTRQLIWGTIIFSIIYGVVFLFVGIFQCTPVTDYWSWDGTATGHCMDRNAVQWASAIISIIVDVWMLAIPLWSVRKLQMHWKTKLGVVSMFLVGGFVTIICCIRLRYLNDFINSNNPTQGIFDILRWSTIEGFTSIICACMPVFRQMLVRAFPGVLGGNTQNKSYGSSGSGPSESNGSRIQSYMSSRMKPWTLRSSTSSFRDDSEPITNTHKAMDSNPDAGIVRETSYAVDFSMPGPIGDLENLDMRQISTPSPVYDASLGVQSYRADASR